MLTHGSFVAMAGSSHQSRDQQFIVLITAPPPLIPSLNVLLTFYIFSSGIMSATPVPSEGTHTLTTTQIVLPPTTTTVVLKKPKPKGVKWDESTAIDNEHMGKKSSKVCCIYHKPKQFGESDSEDDCNHGEKNAYDRQPCSKK